MQQIITPNPNIPCQPGWCLQYVRQTYGLPGRYNSATEAWEASDTKHYGRDFPEGCWTPVWYGVAGEPLGHVVLLAPDGSVYSTSDLSNVPHHHPNLADLEWFYAHYGMALTYRGWTEDVAGYPVITPSPAGIASMGEVITAVSEEDALTPDQMQELKQFFQSDNEARHVATRNAITEELAKKIVDSSYDVKVFTQSVDNQNADRVINDVRAQGK